jgi:outer membrane protein OmpA-like peptidoglycan-associated protein
MRPEGGPTVRGHVSDRVGLPRCRASIGRGIVPIAGLAAMLAASVVGCVLPPAEHPALDQARAAVERARSAPRVRGLAAAELDRAEITLERARAAAEAGAPASHVEHLAYVASRQAALAEAHAADRVAQAEIEELQGALGRLRADAPAADLPGSSAGGEAPPAPRIDASLPDLTLALSELAFDEAAPSGETARKLDEVAERLLGEPGRRLSIEADFDLPAPVARTAMERRVETVRAALLRRGIDPARISVRAVAPPEQRALSSFDRLAP